MEIIYHDDKKEKPQSIEAKAFISKHIGDHNWDVDINIGLISYGEDQKEAKRNFVLAALKTIEFLNKQIEELKAVL